MNTRLGARSLGVCLLLGGAHPVLATVRDVPSSYSTIASALGVSSAGDTVRVACGTYSEQFLTIPDGVTLISATASASCVTLDPMANDAMILITAGGPTTRIEGITVANATLGDDLGPALSGSGSPTVVSCEFRNNSQEFLGGAVYMTGGPRFERCRFLGNIAGDFGAVYVDGGSFIACDFVDNEAYEGTAGAIGGDVTIIDSCRFIGNTSGLDGGAVYACVDTLRDSLFWRNVLDDNGGGFNGGAGKFLCPVVIERCTFVGNRIDSVDPELEGAAVYLPASSSISHSIFAGNVLGIDVANGGAIGCSGAGTLQVECTNIWGTVGTGDWVGCVAGQLGSNGNISADAMFCNPTYGNFTLFDGSPSYTAACGRQGAYGYGCVLWPITGVGGSPATAREHLHQNVPNPFNPSTTIRYEVPVGGAHVEIVVFDVTGRQVRSLVRGAIRAGTNSIDWNGQDDQGHVVPSGVYFCQMRLGGVSETRSMVLLK